MDLCLIYFDIIENTDLLTNKIDEIEKKQRENPDSVSASDKQSLKDMLKSFYSAFLQHIKWCMQWLWKTSNAKLNQ